MPVITNRFHQRGTLVVVCLATAMLMLDIAVVNTALPYLARDLHAGLTGLQWVVDAYTVALAAVVLSAGSISDRRGRRRVFARGIALFTASSLACAESSSIAVLDGARAVQGVAAALMFASSLAILADAFPDARERAGALAAYGATIGGSFAIGPAVGGALTSGLGWRAVFLINVPLGVAGLLATAAWLRESRDPRAHRLDWPGQLLLTSGLFLLVLGLLRGNSDGWGSAPIVAELAGAVALVVTFVAVERRSRTPMLPMALFARRDFTAAQVAAFAISASFFAMYLYMTLYLQDILHLSALDSGLVYLPGSVLLFAVAGASARLAGRVAPARLIAGGLMLVCIGLALMTMTGARSSWTAILPGDLVVCIGTGIFNPALGAVALGAGSGANSGLLAGVNDAFRQGGLAIGVACFGALVPAASALGHGPATAYVEGFHHALLVGAALAAVGAIGTVALLRSRAVTSPIRPSIPPPRRRSKPPDHAVNPPPKRNLMSTLSSIRPSDSTLGEKLILASHPGYDAARTAWNLAIDQRPAAVVRAQSPDDVIAAIAYARTQGLRIAPQGTGHNAGPLGSLADTLLLRTDLMRGVRIDPQRRVVRVAAGALWVEVVEAAAAHGLAALAGSSPDVGVVGYTLGGGVSWLGRRYGLAASHVEAIELVTADGCHRRVDHPHEPDLFWALRGGGGDFGVVTAIELQLLPITHAYAGILWYPISRGHEVLHGWRELTLSHPPEELTTVGRFLQLPPIPEIPEPVRGKSFVVVEAYHVGDPAQADELLAPLRALGPLNDTVQTVPMPALSHIHMDPEHPVPGHGDGLLLGAMPAEAIDAIEATAGAEAAFPLLSVELRHLGGELARARPRNGSLAALEAEYALYAVGATPVPQLEGPVRAQVEAVMTAMSPWKAEQSYLNFAETPQSTGAFWPGSVQERLRAIKGVVDPDGLIRSNHPVRAIH